jgi:hypothetical protein
MIIDGHASILATLAAVTSLMMEIDGGIIIRASVFAGCWALVGFHYPSG